MENAFFKKSWIDAMAPMSVRTQRRVINAVIDYQLFGITEFNLPKIALVALNLIIFEIDAASRAPESSEASADNEAVLTESPASDVAESAPSGSGASAPNPAAPEPSKAKTEAPVAANVPQTKASAEPKPQEPADPQPIELAEPYIRELVNDPTINIIYTIRGCKYGLRNFALAAIREMRKEGRKFFSREELIKVAREKAIDAARRVYEFENF